MGDAVGLVGLGIMGSAMSANLVKSGLRVVGYDIDADKVRALTAAGGVGADSPRQVAEQADVVITVLPSAQILHEALTAGSGLVAARNRELTVADCGTFDIADKKRCQAALVAAGMDMLDCPISGTGSQARTKDVVVYASGDESRFARCRPAFDGFARASHYVGEFGNGSKMKFIANLLVAIHNVAAAEAMVLAQRAGLDLQTVYDLVRSGAGTSRMFEVRGPMMVAGEYHRDVTSKLDLWQKDMQVIGRFAGSLECPVTLFSMCAEIYAAAMGQGLAKSDTAAVCAVLERFAGIDRPGRSTTPGDAGTRAAANDAVVAQASLALLQMEDHPGIFDPWCATFTAPEGGA